MNSTNPILVLQDAEECLTRQAFKDKAMKCKVIALAQLKYDPIHTNPSTLPPRIKKQILSIMSNYIIAPDSEVDAEFNEIVNGEILVPSAEYEKYNVHITTTEKDSITLPKDPPTEDEYREPEPYTQYSTLTPEEMWRM